MSTTVLLADDHELMRHAIVQFLEVEGANDIQILGQAASYAQTLELASGLRPRVILLDVYLKDKDGVTEAQLGSALVGSRVLAMSLRIDDETKTFAKTIGAVALLDKANLVSELIPAIRSCANDQVVGLQNETADKLPCAASDEDSTSGKG